MRWRHSSVVRHFGLYLWRSKQAVTNVQLGYWNDDMCIIFAVCFYFVFFYKYLPVNWLERFCY